MAKNDFDVRGRDDKSKGMGPRRREDDRNRRRDDRSTPRSRGRGKFELTHTSSRGNYAMNLRTRGGRSEFRRRNERGPRFGRQKLSSEWGESEGSDLEEKPLRLRARDEDSDMSFDEVSASTTESMPSEKLHSDSTKKHGNQRMQKVMDEQNMIEYSVSEHVLLDNDKLKAELKGKNGGGFSPRGEPSRRGRGRGFRSRDGNRRITSSNYGPPPSKAAFGSEKLSKVEHFGSKKEVCEELKKEKDEKGETKNDTIKDVKDPTNLNKFDTALHQQKKNNNRFDKIPPRFQRNRRYETFELFRGGRGGRGGRGRGGNSRGGSSNKRPQLSKQNSSEMVNEEWETASENSDVADRREKKDSRGDAKLDRDIRERHHAGKKSFSSQRPGNDQQNRRSDLDGERKGKKDTPNKEGIEKRGGGQRNANTNFATNRNNRSQTGKNLKNETLLFRVDEIKLNDVSGVQQVFADISTRKANSKKLSEVAVITKLSKLDKDKNNALDGIDLNNYASVVIVDDQPEVSVDDPTYIFEMNNGFQEVMSKKAQKERQKAMIEAEIMKQNQSKKEDKSKSKNNRSERARSSKLPPRLAKQRENNRLNQAKRNSPQKASSESMTDVNSNMKMVVSSATTKETTPAPLPTVNAWDKPITSTLRSQSPLNAHLTEVPVINSKSSSFDRSENHDSGIEISDQPPSTTSSQRSSPSNDCKLLFTKGSPVCSSVILESNAMVTDEICDVKSSISPIVLENKNKTETAPLRSTKFVAQTVTQIENSKNRLHKVECSKSIESENESEIRTDSIMLEDTISKSYKTEEVKDVKLDFSFHSDLTHITKEKVGLSRAVTKPVSMPRPIQMQPPNTVSFHSQISPSAAELNLKIASVKKVWESVMPTVLEHPVGSVTEEQTNLTTANAGVFSTFTSKSEQPAGSYSTSTETNSENYTASAESNAVALSAAGETSCTESNDKFTSCSPMPPNAVTNLSFTTISPYSPSTTNTPIANVVTKSIEHSNVCKVKPQQQSPSIQPPMSPVPHMSSINNFHMANNQIGLSNLSNSPAVHFNNTQQTGLYQTFPVDGASIVGQPPRAPQFSQLTHYNTAYSLSQPPGMSQPQLSNTFSHQQQNMFIQTPPSPSVQPAMDLYQSNQYRIQSPFAQSHLTTNQNTVLLPSNSGLMATSMKSSPSSNFGTIGTKTSGQMNPYGQTGITASALFIQYDPNPLLNQQSLQSQLLNSQLVQRPNPVTMSSLAGLPPTTFYSTSNQQASGFYQPTSASTIQQPSFGLQSYGSQNHVSIMPQNATGISPFRGPNPLPFKAQHQPVATELNPIRSHSRSPSLDCNSLMFSSSNLISGSGSNLHQQLSSPSNSKLSPLSMKTASKPLSQFCSQEISTTTNYVHKQQHIYGQQHYGQQQFNNMGPNYPSSQNHNPALIRSQPILLGSNVVRHSTPQMHHHHQHVMRFPAPIQRPGNHMIVSQPQPLRNTVRSQIMHQKSSQLSTAQQAKLRAEVLQQTQKFFNSQIVPGSISLIMASNTSVKTDDPVAIKNEAAVMVNTMTSEESLLNVSKEQVIQQDQMEECLTTSVEVGDEKNAVEK